MQESQQADPLEGLDELVSNTLAILGAPPPPGNPLLSAQDGTSGVASGNAFSADTNAGASDSAFALVDLRADSALKSGGPSAAISNNFSLTDDLDLDLLGVPAGAGPGRSVFPGGLTEDHTSPLSDLDRATSDVPLGATSSLGGRLSASPARVQDPLANVGSGSAGGSPTPGRLAGAAAASSSPAAAVAFAQPSVSSLQALPGGGDGDEVNPFAAVYAAKAQASLLRQPLGGSEGHQASMGSASTGLGVSGGFGASGSGGGASDGEEHTVKVVVRDPERVESISKLGLRTTHYTYLVRTEATLPSLRAEGTEVRRRFSEFDALHKLLRVHCRGYFVPPVPDKSFIEARLGHEDFLRLRRADLQGFLRGVVSHPVLRESEAVRLFLLQPGELQYNPAWIALSQAAAHSRALLFGDPIAALDAQAAAGGYASLSSGSSSSTSGAKAGAALAGLMSWVKYSVVSQLSPGATNKRVEDLGEEERALRQAKEMLKDLGKLLQLCCENARALYGHNEAFSADLAELGRNMGMLSKWEEALQQHSGQYTAAGASAQQRAADSKGLAYALMRQHTLWKNAGVKTAASLVSLHDYFILVPEAVSALEERERLLERVWELQDEVDAKKNSVASGKAGSRAPAVSNQVERLEEALRAARDAYATVKARNQEELLRLQLAREKDFHAMAANFTRVQAQLMQASADMWLLAANRFSSAAQQPEEEDGDEEAHAGGGSGGAAPAAAASQHSLAAGEGNGNTAAGDSDTNPWSG